MYLVSQEPKTEYIDKSSLPQHYRLKLKVIFP